MGWEDSRALPGSDNQCDLMFLKYIRQITWVYLLILLLGSVLPINGGSSPLNNTYIVEVRSDYLLHALLLLPFPMLLVLRLRKKSNIWLRIVVLGLMIVLFCEGVQLLLPYRTFNINDLFANGVGAIIGLIPAGLVWRRFSGSVR